MWQYSTPNVLWMGLWIFPVPVIVFFRWGRISGSDSVRVCVNVFVFYLIYCILLIFIFSTPREIEIGSPRAVYRPHKYYKALKSVCFLMHHKHQVQSQVLNNTLFRWHVVHYFFFFTKGNFNRVINKFKNNEIHWKSNKNQSFFFFLQKLKTDGFFFLFCIMFV